MKTEIDPNLAEYIKRYISISDEELTLVASFLTPKKLKKKEYLLQEGRICHSRYFVTKGCFRVYYLDPKGVEQIVHFGLEYWWITDYNSLIAQCPSVMNIQAIEDAEVLVLNEEKLEELCAKLPKIERFFRKIMEKTYMAIQKRMEYMFSMSGEEMYDVFVTANPEFARRVPQYMLASYLGFTPEFLSKMKAKKYK